MLNKWSESEVNRAESSWGKITPPYTIDMFEFAVSGDKSWLDLGCGFGRFLKFLDARYEEPDYIGYDSSPDMINRIRENFPQYSPRLFVHNITDPILNEQDSIICSAVLIHLPATDQDKILDNIKAVNPRFITFDINSPSERGMKWDAYNERVIKGADNTFRMTWQSHYAMTRKVLQKFSKYNLSVKFYTVNINRFKVVYMLRRKVD